MDIKNIAGIVVVTALTSSTLTYQYTHEHGKRLERENTEIAVSREYFGPKDSLTIEDRCFSGDNHQTARGSKKNKALKSQTNQSALSRQQSETPQSAQDVDAESTRELRSRIREQENNISKFSKTLSSSTGDQARDLAQRNYDSEKKDYEWANRKEEELLSIFDNDESLQSIAPLDLSCKSENCKLVLPTADTTQSGSMSQSVLKAVSEIDKDTKSSISYFTNEDKGQLVIYVSEKDTMSLFEHGN